MPNMETPSELADHLADLLGIGQDSRCMVIGWDNPPDFIGPIPEHIQNCDCRVFWILEMTNSIRKAVVNEITQDLSNRKLTIGAEEIGRLSFNKSNLKPLEALVSKTKELQRDKFSPPTITGRLVDKGLELQDPRGLDIERSESKAGYNQIFDMDYAELETRVLDSLSKRDLSIAKNFFDMYGPVSKTEGKTSMQVTAFIESR